MRNWTQSCLTDSTPTKQFFYDCLNLNQELVDQAKKCIWSVDFRFEDGANYNLIGYITLAHCVSPFLLGFFIFAFLENKSIWKIPVPIVTKLRRFILECQFFHERTKEYFMRNIIKYENNLKECISFVNLSSITEASSESAFQIWIQTLNMMPLIILIISKYLNQDDIHKSAQIDDLLNLRGFSILTSFVTISTSFYNIR